MARIRFLMLKSLAGLVFPSNPYTKSMRVGDHLHLRPLFGVVGHNYHMDSHSRSFNFEPRAGSQLYKPNYASGFSPALLNCHFRGSFPLLKMTPMLGSQSYSSFAGGKGVDKGPEVPEASGTSDIDVTEWVDKVKDAWKSVAEVATVTGEKAKQASDELAPYAQQVLDSHPYLRDVVVPVGGTLTATLLAWVVFPRILKRLHSYSMKGTAALLHGSVFAVVVPYEKSVWGALEDPVRYLMTFMAFSEICYLVAPNAVASQYIGQAWKGAVVLSFVWFLQRWKTNLFARALAAQNVQLLDRERILTLDKMTSVGLFTIGVMALAEACGVAVQSILTVGGIGGVATAFASKDILGNVLSGLSMQFSKPFSLGDTIKAGSIEGQVVEMGLTTTSLLNAERFPVIVPNSLFSSQVIVNKSRAEWRAFFSKIPLQFDNLENIPQISNDIKSMMRSNQNVFLGKEAPYCYLTRIDSSSAELTLGCNLKRLSKDEHYTTEQDILLESIRIIKQHGASLGSSY